MPLTFHEISAAQQSIPRTKSKIFSQDRLPLSSSSLAIIPYLSAAFFGTAVAWFPSSFFQHKISSFPLTPPPPPKNNPHDGGH